MHATRAAHLILRKEYKLWSSPLCNFLHPPVSYFLLPTDILLSTLLKHPQSAFSPLVERPTISCNRIVRSLGFFIRSHLCRHEQTVNPLKPSGNYMYHLLWQSVTLHFVFMCFVRFSEWTEIISQNSIYRRHGDVLFSLRYGLDS
jgi:hypothetical protein